MSEKDFSTGVDVWNIADGYVKLKILYPLVEIDKLQKIALYGSETIEGSFTLSQTQKTVMRIEALQRFLDTLKILYENTKELLKSKCKTDFEKISERIGKVYNALDRISRIEVNTVNNKRELIIDEKHFLTCLDILREIKTDIVKPLNDSNMIFPQSDEIDLEADKNRLIMGG